MLKDVTCVYLCLQSRLSFTSVVFDFSASLNDVAPVSPMLLAVDLMRMEKSGLFMDAICVLFILSSLLRSSSMSVVFDFNASLNDVVPLSPMLPVDLMRIEERTIDGCLLCCFFCAHIQELVD